MKIYMAECHDRHIDPVVKVFDSPEAAITYAKNFVHDNARHKDSIEEEKVDWALYYCRYSNEGDRVWVKEGKLNKVIVPQSFDEFIEALHDAGWRGIHDAQHEHIRAVYEKRT